MRCLAEVNKKYDISIATLRYYERIGLIPPVNRSASGVRDYTEQDCEWVYFIKCMRTVGLSIESLIEYVTLFQQGKSTVMTRKNLLIEQRNLIADRIEEMKQKLERLDHKIDGYEDRFAEYEKKLEM